jgi:hypothetical protein
VFAAMKKARRANFDECVLSREKPNIEFSSGPRRSILDFGFCRRRAAKIDPT